MKLPTAAAVKHWFTDPVVRTKQFFINLSASFGWRFVVMVMFGEHLLKGFLNGGGAGGFFVIESRCYMAMEIGAAQRTTLSAMSSSPWALKPIFGMISDVVVFWKMRRMPWIMVTAVLALISYALILGLQKSAAPSLLAMCFFFGRMQCSWTDLMVESCYTAKMRVVPEHSSDILTWVWAGIGIGGVFAFIVVGSLLDTIGPFVSAAIPLAVSGLPMIPAALGWLGETPCTTPACGIRRDIIKEQRDYFFAGIVLAIAVLISVGCSVANLDNMSQCIVALVCSAAVCVAAIYFLPHALWGPMLFMFFSSALAISTYGFIDNFYLDPATAEESAETGYPICYDCPHFDNYFYVTVVGIVDSVFMAVGSWIFNAWISKWKYRSAFLITQIIFMLASIVDIIQFQRWNKAIGIPDWVFMLGKLALQNTCNMMNFLPSMILISKLCPIGMESTVFSLLAGFGNYGSTVSQYVGGYVIVWIGLGDIGSGTVDDFSNAWIACLINACMPLLVLLLLPFMIPDAYMTEDLANPTTDKDGDFLKDGGSSQREVEEGDDLMDTEMEVGDYVAGQSLAPVPTPLIGFADELQGTDSNRHLVGEDAAGETF